MASSINASTSGAGGVITTADNTGILNLQTGGTTAVTVDASQNVGIGTTSPATKLQVTGASGSLNARINAGNTGLDITSNDATGVTDVATSPLGAGGKVMTFTTYNGSSSAERMRIDSGGGVLMGTTTNTPGYKLYVKGGDGNQLILDNAGSTYTTMNYYNNGTNKLTLFWDNSTPRYYVVPAAGGGVYLAAGGTSWTASSDERVKDIIEPITDAANKVSTLRAVIGKYKTDEEGTRRAFLIAQDVHQVFPEAVDTANENEYGLRYQDTIPLLVAAIKEQQTIINDLKARIETLEAK